MSLFHKEKKIYDPVKAPVPGVDPQLRLQELEELSRYAKKPEPAKMPEARKISLLGGHLVINF